MSREQARKLKGLIIETALLVEDLEGSSPARKFLSAAVELMSIAYRTVGKKHVPSSGSRESKSKEPPRPGSGSG
jgi:hypothetical protein